MRVCWELDCEKLTEHTRCAEHERAWQAKRNARPERSIYRGGWPAESRAIRKANPFCGVCGRYGADTVDHPTRLPMHRACHNGLEEQRKRERRGTA